MCVIIYQPKGRVIPYKRLVDAYNANPDGCGIMFVQNHMLIHFKGVYDFRDFYWRYIFHAVDHNSVIHFRTASSGSIDDRHCHPFWADPDTLVMENGNLYHFANGEDFHNDDMTDIERFNKEILQKLPHNWIFRQDIIQVLEKYCVVNFTKIVLMHVSGKILIINENAGEWIDGCWYSNGGIKNYNGYGYSGAYYYNENDIRHKGGIVTNFLLPKLRRDNWSKCKACSGFFHDLHGNVCGDCKVFLELKKYTVN